MPNSLSDSSVRNRSDSTADSGMPEHEHKRPRLSDSKMDGTQVMSDLHVSAGPAAPSTSEIVSRPNKTPQRDKTPPVQSESSPPSVTVLSPTSKVTINTRPLSALSLTQAVQSGGGDMPNVECSSSDHQLSASSDTPPNVNTPQSTSHEPADIPETISISSSPSKSPEIEVAEIEDYDQDPAHTRWTSRIGGSASVPLFSQAIQPGHVYRTFPYAADVAPGNASRTVIRIQDIFQHAGGQEGEIFVLVKNWLTDFVSECTHFPAILLDDDREFWNRVPGLVEGLLRRQTGPPARARIEDLVDFFVAYVHLTKLLMEHDIQMLSHLKDDSDLTRLRTLNTASAQYLQPLIWILQTPIPFYEAINRVHAFDIARFHINIVDKVTDPAGIDLLKTTSNFLLVLSSKLAKRQDLFRPYLNVLNVVWHIMRIVITPPLDVQLPRPVQIDHVRKMSEKILLNADAALQNAVVKQLSWLNLDTAPKLIELINPMMIIIAVEVPQIGQDIVSSAGVGFADSDLTDLPSTMPYAWKFKTLRKFITNGRMELRVYGVDIMSADLVYVFNHIIDGKLTPTNAVTNPLVRFLANFIKETRLVEYIVGVDSHPQIIRRAHNVVGFLCVSGTYSDSTTDEIWKHIVEGQDIRTVHEVFNLLRTCFNVYSLAAEYYICQKLCAFPFERLDETIVSFIIQLFDSIRANVGFRPNPNMLPIGAVTRQLCIRFLREAAVEENLLLDYSLIIRREFPQQLNFLVNLGQAGNSVDDDEVRNIFSEITSDVRAHNRFAGGDLLVLGTLIQTLPKDDLSILVKDLDLTSALVEEIVHIGNNFDPTRPSLVTETIYEIRARALHCLILRLPNTFTPELIETLWKSFFTSQQVLPSVRAKSWTTLCNTLRERAPDDHNIVLDRIINTHMQQLQPQDYCEPLLEFMKLSMRHLSRDLSHQQTPPSDGVVFIPGMDRLWKVMLEAPPNTIENEATDYIIQQYLDHHLIMRQSKATIDATHASLVDRCVQQVIASASRLKSFTDGTVLGEDEPMVVIASESEIRAEELCFDRSLLFLRKFLEAIKGHPHYGLISSPVPSFPEFPNKKGETLDLNIQIFGSKHVSERMQKISTGRDNTGDELHKYLSDASGFSKFTVFHIGQKIILDQENTTLHDLKMWTGLLMVKKDPNSTEVIRTRSARASSPVDSKVMHHFDELYGLLDSEERLAREVYSFLSLFSAQTEVVSMIRSMTRSAADVLPPEKPFKLLYCARALRSCIEYESFSSDPDARFLVYGVQVITNTLPSLELSPAQDSLRNSIVHSLLEALLLAFRAKVSTGDSLQYIQNHQDFAAQVTRLCSFAVDNNCVDPELSASVMARLVLETFIEASLHDDRVWKCVDLQNKLQDMLMTIVNDVRPDVRHTLLDVILMLTGGAGSKILLKVNNPRAPRSRFPATSIEACLSHLWTALVEILPVACLQPQNSGEMCESMLSIIKRIGKSFAVDALCRYLKTWSSILLDHQHIETVGQPLADFVVAGLAKLLLECCKLLNAVHKLPPSTKLIEEIITGLLFPPLSGSKGTIQGTTNLPMLDSNVRESLYSLVLILCQESDDFQVVITKLGDDLLPQDLFEPLWGNDRQQLRTEVGYAGLRNLSNTCYLNSLFSQLFMNVEFREIFLNSRILDRAKPGLVLELAKVFAFMQNSYEKCVDPVTAVEAITTYDGEQIDVSVQMDVDEFFNLLFDRLEGQIDGPYRDVFKSIYGGQLVQQIKSRECEHISERLEPFSAVQVEIKGKAKLEDSLRAYVEGEVLQGENKYSCTSCGRHVDAVKRSCLKEVPDHLIFNLKRFDYDIMTGMRTKVNDEFRFPDILDMAPYTLARLSEDDQSEEPDQFELTGIIVHSGTADSGHYYSYIRQRPSAKDVADSWVQFNDQDVTTFDSTQMREQCFGGVTESYYNLPKFYNAYMLFYQRTSSISKIAQRYRTHDFVNPIRLPLPSSMDRHIAQTNELYLRSYCAQDGTHAKFIFQLFERLRAHSEQCSAEHTLETNMLEMVLDYIREVSSRWKDLPFVEDTMKSIQSCVEQCPRCTQYVAEWLEGPRILEDVIVRSPYSVVRKAFAGLMTTTAGRLHDLRMNVKFDEDEDDEDEEDSLSEKHLNWLESCVSQLARLWDVVSKNGRCWGEYFFILNGIQKLGDDELAMVLNGGFIEKCYEMAMVHLNSPVDYPISRKLKARYSAYINARDKNRTFNHSIVFRLLVNLLTRVDLSLMPSGEVRIVDPKIGLSKSELEILGIINVPSQFEWLRRLLAGRTNIHAIDDIIECFSRDRLLAVPVKEVILAGLNDKLINMAVNFLRPALVFVQHCTSDDQTMDLVQGTLDSIQTVGVEYSRDYHEFVEALLQVENANLGHERGFLIEVVVNHVHCWAPTFLAAPLDPHANVQLATVGLLRQYLFNPLQRADGQDVQEYRRLRHLVRELAVGCSTFVQTTFLNNRGRDDTTIQPGQVNQMIDVVDVCSLHFDAEDPADEERLVDLQQTMAALRSKAENSAEAMSTAEWQENSSDLAEVSGQEDDYVSTSP